MTPAGATTLARPRGSDAGLLQACLRGDQQAWAALIERYKNLIFSIPLRQGISSDDAAEIFQAVCVSLLAELPNLRDPQALPAWLIRITLNRCHLWRRQLRQRAALEQPDEGEVDSAPAAGDDFLHQLEMQQSLQTAIHQLTPQCQRLIQMLFFEAPARPYEEIAASLGLARGSIGFTRARCLEKLRQQLLRVGFQE